MSDFSLTGECPCGKMSVSHLCSPLFYFWSTLYAAVPSSSGQRLVGTHVVIDIQVVKFLRPTRATAS